MKKTEFIVERLAFGASADDDVTFSEGEIIGLGYPTAEKNCWTIRHKNGSVVLIGAGAAIYGRSYEFEEEAEIPEGKE